VSLAEAGRQLNIAEGLKEPPTKRRRVEEDAGKQKQDEFARALFAAMRLCESKAKKTVPISQLGSDLQVAKLRKDPLFKKVKLVDILQAYPSVFELSPEPPPGTNFLVSLTPEAELALPQRSAGDYAPKGAGDVLPDPEQLKLPPKIDNPSDQKEVLQALRIEIIHALHRRQGVAGPGDIGQEPGVQRCRRELPKGKPLTGWIRLFPGNFSEEPDPSTGTSSVRLVSMNVEDRSSIDQFMGKSSKPAYRQASDGGPVGILPPLKSAVLVRPQASNAATKIPVARATSLGPDTQATAGVEPANSSTNTPVAQATSLGPGKTTGQTPTPKAVPASKAAMAKPLSDAEKGGF